MSAKTGTDGKIDASTVKRAIQQHNQAVSGMASLSLMTWRQESNDMNKRLKRLGKVRASEGSQGVWARMACGRSKYGQQGIKNQYQSILSWEASHERGLS